MIYKYLIDQQDRLLAQFCKNSYKVFYVLYQFTLVGYPWYLVVYKYCSMYFVV